MHKNVLVLGAGKQFKEAEGLGDLIRCVDKLYKNNDLFSADYNRDKIELISDDIFKYLENCLAKYDLIKADRLFEHIPPDKIPYLLYLCELNLNPEGTLEFTVPDFSKVLEKLNTVDGTMGAVEFNRLMIQIHTEIFNEPNDPHLSVWTKNLIYYYIGLEGLWRDLFITDVTIDGRNWYLNVLVKTIRR